MAEPIRFAGSNIVLNPAPGTENAVQPLHTFHDGREHISLWKLTPEEVEHVVRTGEVWASTLTGASAPQPFKVSGAPLMTAVVNGVNTPGVYTSDGSYLVEAAASWAREAHAGQTYGDGLPYTYHLEKVVEVVRDFGGDHRFQIAAWLHDIVEDCMLDLDPKARVDQVEERCGTLVAKMVWAVSGFGDTRRERNADQYAKIAAFPLSAAVKYADRIANTEACLVTGGRLSTMYKRENADFDEAIGRYAPEEMRARLRRATLALSD